MIVFACDVECVQGLGGRSLLAKCVIINYTMDIVLNVTLKPNERVQNYVTWITGIRRGDLDNGVEYNAGLDVIRRTLALADICVFHDPTNDLKVIGYQPARVIDTSMNTTLNEKAGLVRRYGERTGLKKLAKAIWNIEMQDGTHCPVEDAMATMRLYQLISSSK